MRRLGASGLNPAAAVLAIAIWVTATQARAEITVHDSEGWRIYTTGLVAAHYQLVLGDHDPATSQGVLVGGKILPQGSEDPRDMTLTNSRLRSGFVGTQIAWGIDRQISERTRVESLIAINLADVSSNRGQNLPKGVDVREAWAAVVTPGGTFKFGRMFSIFGSASSQVVLLAYRYGIGNPCSLDQPTISCGSVGAGPLYPGFDAQFRYSTPRVAGFELQLAVSDPLVGPSYQMTPFPRVEGEINFDRRFSPSFRVRAYAQGVGLEVRRVVDNAMTMARDLKQSRVWGGMGSAVVDLGGLSVGGGGWTGAGIGTRTVMEVGDAANPLAYDSTGELRKGRGFFGNASFDLKGTVLAAGSGIAYMAVTAADISPGSNISLIAQSFEWHVVLSKRIDTVVLTAEHMQWKNKWYYGEKQDLMFTGVGANYYW